MISQTELNKINQVSMSMRTEMLLKLLEADFDLLNKNANEAVVKVNRLQTPVPTIIQYEHFLEFRTHKIEALETLIISSDGKKLILSGKDLSTGKFAELTKMV